MRYEKFIIRFLTAAACCAFALPAAPQKPQRQTVVLNDGSRVTGTIVSDSPEYLFIKVKVPQVIALRKSDISLYEGALIEYPSEISHKGYFIHFSASILAGQNESLNTHSMSIHLSNGYQFKNGISVGLGSGLEELEVPVLPVYADIRYNPLKTRISPYVWVKGGYGFALVDKSDGSGHWYTTYPDQSGGLLLNTGAGILLYSWKRNAVNIGVGYRYQRIISLYDEWWGVNSTRELIREFNRIEFQFGFVFR